MNTYKILIANIIVFAMVMAVFFVDTFSNMSFLKLVINGLIHSIWIVALYLVINFVFSREAFKTILEVYRGKKSK